MQARTLHGPSKAWPGEQDAAELMDKIPAMLQRTRASHPALASQLAELFVQHAAAFNYRGPVDAAPAAFLALANEIQVCPARKGQQQPTYCSQACCAATAALQKALAAVLMLLAADVA
jgi:hypothetical protein